jgi:hypothetical protein
MSEVSFNSSKVGGQSGSKSASDRDDVDFGDSVSVAPSGNPYTGTCQ